MECAPSIDLPVKRKISVVPASQGAILGFTLGLVCQEVVNLGNGTVECNYFVSVVSCVQNQVLAHDGQADKAEVSSRSIVS